MKVVQLKCSVSNGMFPGEAGASFSASNGEEISLFCAEKYVDKKNKLITVKLLGKHDGFASVRLPAESLAGFRVVQVKDEQVKEMQTA
jgi:hypothetical protein